MLAIAIACCLVGILLLGLSTLPPATHWGAAVLRDLGALLIVSAALTLIWELVAKRAFLEEILNKANVSQEINAAGVDRIRSSFHEGIDWGRLFNESDTLHVFMAYGYTWRNSRRPLLSEWLREKSTKLTVTLPDPDNPEVTGALASRFGLERAELERRVRAAITDFAELRNGADRSDAVTVFLTSRPPLFTFYKFRNSAVLTLYNHGDGRVDIPVLLINRGGWLYRFISDEARVLASADAKTREYAWSEVDGSAKH